MLGVSPETREGILARRGKLRAYFPLVAKSCALLIIDMQNCFVAPGGVLEVPGARDMVERINWLARRCRELDVPLIWAQHTTEDGGADQGVHLLFFGADQAREVVEAYSRGSWGHALWPGLDVQVSDHLIAKKRFSCLWPGSSPLAALLNDLGRNTLMLAGVRTGVCCESTARDAMMQGLKVIFLADCTAGRSEREQQQTMDMVASLFGDVLTAEEAMSELSGV